MTLCTIGIDLAKLVFQVHGADENGKKLFSKRLTRAQFLPFMANQPPCLVGMESCSSAHHYGRVLTKLGHEVKLIPPQYVKPYVKTNKTDAADAEAICEAVTRPTMRFVPIKTQEQQAILSVHRQRHLLMKMKIQASNNIRGILSEYGIVMPKGYSALFKKLPEIVEDADLPIVVIELVQYALDHVKKLNADILMFEKQLQQLAKQNEAVQRLITIPGIGILTSTYIVGAIGSGRQFQNCRQFASWVGLTPSEHSSGGKQHLGRITKRGDKYLRGLLVHGCRALLSLPTEKRPPLLTRLLEKKRTNVAIVAQAARNARIVWAILVSETTYSMEKTINRI